MQEPTTQEQKLWASISQLAEEESGQACPPSVAQVSQQPTVLDRLTARLNGGTLPLFLLSLLALLLIGPKEHISTFFLGPPLALIACWLLAPLLRNRSGASGILLLLAGPVLAYTVLSQTLPLLLSDSNNVNVHYDSYTRFAAVLQSSLEAVLYPTHLIAFVIGSLALAVLMNGAKRLHPWVEPQTTSLHRQVLSVLVAVAPFALATGFVLSLEPNREAAGWIAEAKVLQAEHAVGPVAVKPPEYDALDWGVLWRNTYSEAELKAKRQKIQQFVVDTVKNHPPSETEPLWMAGPVYQVLRFPDNGLSPKQRAELAFFGIAANVNARDIYKYVGTQELLEAHVLPFLTTEALSRSELDSWNERLDRVNSRLTDTFTELDLNAADYFFSEERRYSETFGDGYRTRTKAKPRDLKAFGRSFETSPTRLAFRRDELQTIEEWVGLRDKLRAVPAPEVHQQLQDLVRDGSPFDRLFIETLEGRRYGDTVGPWLETVILIVRLRQQKLETGRYPEPLPSQTDRHATSLEWESTPEGLKLTASDLQTPQGTFSWLLP
jgi:hypothetical protein